MLYAYRFFEAGACELRIGVYESFDTLCIYLESDALASPERNFWVKYRIAVVNQRHPDRTEWKDSAICTKTWNNSVLQFMKVCGRHSTIVATCMQDICHSIPVRCMVVCLQSCVTQPLARIILTWDSVSQTAQVGSCTKSACPTAFSKSFGIQVSEIMDPEAGHVHRDGVVLACEVLECCPWFEFADLDVYGNTTEEEADDLSTDPDELLELGPHAPRIHLLTSHSAQC